MKRGLFFLLSYCLISGLIAQEVQWKEITTPVKASLRGLSPVSTTVCWASGSQGTWLKTMDGGESWEHGSIAGLDSLDFRAIHAWDDERAIVASAGSPAVVYKTSDGGKTWEKVHEEAEPAFFDALTFLSPNRGFLLGDPIDGTWMLLETYDGGDSWQRLPISPPAAEGEAAFAASNSSLLVNRNILVFGTGGATSNLHLYSLNDQYWTLFQGPLLQGAFSQGIFGLSFVQDGIVAVGGDFEKPDSRDRTAAVFKNQMAEMPNRFPSGYRSGIAYWKQKKLLIAVGPSGSDISLDQGMNWENFSATGFHAVKVSLDQKSIWASGSQGRIGKLISK